MEWTEILSLLSGPIIGMVIGYFTNFLAVKMLFRPLYPKKIGKWTLPFTPGVIPKRKDALAQAMGQAVENQLFTLEDLGKTIASQKVEAAIADGVINGLQTLTEGRNFSQVMEIVIGEETYVDVREQIFEKGLDAICSNVEEMNLGALVGEEVKNYVEAYVAGNSLIGFVLTKDRIARIANQFAERLEDFLAENLELLVAPRLAGEMEKIELLTTDDVPISEEFIRRIVHDVYGAFIEKCLPGILENINIGKTVEEKISAMDARDLEKLVLTVMKKELGAVVNLGAVLGFLIGIVNIFI